MDNGPTWHTLAKLDFRDHLAPPLGILKHQTTPLDSPLPQ